MTSTDRIEKVVILRAPRAVVWNAVADSKQFGTWFNAVVDGPFVAGKTVPGTMTEPGHEGTKFLFFVERVEPERHLSFRWHPFELDLDADPLKAPTTLVAFDLEDAPEGTRLRIVESGFDSLPADRRAASRKSNDEGWTIQAERIAKHVAEAA
jgi:uncharacterized protein YndB with AHSA1/START domain